MRVSFSLSMATGTTLDSPLRAKRGLARARRAADTSKAYSLPVERISAPSSSVLPPAPAQKSMIISRRGATSRASSWLPSSCTSMLPFSNWAQRLMAGRPSMRMPHGEYGIATGS